MRHYFSKRRRSRSRRKRRTRSKSRRRRSRSRRKRRTRSKSRKSRKSKKRHRVGNYVFLENGKKLKVQKDKDGCEFVRSGKKKSKSYVGKTGKIIKKKCGSKKKSRKSRRRRKSSSRKRRRRPKFGRQPGLVSMMGNFRPLSKMNTFQQYTGMSGPQMSKHMAGILKSDRANFYTSV